MISLYSRISYVREFGFLINPFLRGKVYTFAKKLKMKVYIQTSPGRKTMRFGSHVSIRNGYFGAAQTALKIGAKAFQYFPKNPRSLKIKSYDQIDAKKCARFCREHDLKSIAHSPYPTKLSPKDKASQKDIVQSILNDLDIVEDCGSTGLVVHFGTSKGDPLEGYKRMISLLNEVLGNWNGNSLLLIENNAGKGGSMGTTIEELVKVRQLTEHPEKIGFCLDTCHAYASGLWNGDNWDEIELKGKELGFFEHLKAIHLNNSVYPSGSMRDRHANIHNGCIEVSQMKTLIKSALIKELPMILETPSSEKYAHKDEIAYLRTLIKK
jgi:deoxyribonuclease-4